MLPSFLREKSKGFTLIEIVIVLAIAGLIFVIVFFAVTQAQIGRRDTARKNDANRFMAAVSQWSSNKNGQVPDSQADVDDVESKYLNDFADPSTGNGYDVTYGTTAPDSAGEMTFSAGQKCDAELDGFTAANTRDYALLINLEKNGVVTCVDSGG